MNDKLIEYEKHVKTLSFEDLIKEYEHICDLTDNKYIEISNDCIEEGLSWPECYKRYEKCIEYKMSIIARNEYEAKATPELCKKNNLINGKYTDEDCKLTIGQFESSCKSYAITSDDGFGYYADDEYEYSIYANCSNGVVGKSNKNFKYIIWYNK